MQRGGQRGNIDSWIRFKEQKSFSLRLWRGKKANRTLSIEQRSRTNRARRRKGKDWIGRKSRLPRVGSFARSPARSMMLSLHNLRGTVTGSRERMAVPAPWEWKTSNGPVAVIAVTTKTNYGTDAPRENLDVLWNIRAFLCLFLSLFVNFLT